MPRIPYYDVDQATGKHAEFLGKLKPHLNIYRMLANSEYGAKGFVRMGNALLHRCELDPALRELAILRVGRLSRAAYEVFQHERIAREVGVTDDKIAALRDATVDAGGLPQALADRRRGDGAALHRHEERDRRLYRCGEEVWLATGVGRRGQCHAVGQAHPGNMGDDPRHDRRRRQKGWQA